MKNKGITLVALVVTIIIMLILAGITITMALGENGILSQAKLAAKKTKEAEEQQEQDLKNLVGIINEAVNEKDPETLEEALSSKKVFSNTTGYDASGNKIDESSEEKKVPAITIPAGFKIIEGDVTQINKGVVIADQAGNEFVWVPCKDGEYNTHAYTGDHSKDNGKNIADTEGGWNTLHYKAYSDWTDDGTNETSVKKYGGFYIARYEAGIPSSMTGVYVNSKSEPKNYTYEDERNNSNYAPISKKGVQAWNYIDQIHAKSVSEKMYSGSSSVTSQLIDGKAWDRTVDWIVANSSATNIEKSSTNYGNYLNTKNLNIEENILYALHLEKMNAQNGGTGWNPPKNYSYGTPAKIGVTNPYNGNDFENYRDVKDTSVHHYRQLLELSTGASKDTEVNKIYDLAGNMYEWTTETGYHDEPVPEEADITRTQYAVIRGGSFGQERWSRSCFLSLWRK